MNQDYKRVLELAEIKIRVNHAPRFTLPKEDGIALCQSLLQAEEMLREAEEMAGSDDLMSWHKWLAKRKKMME